MSQPAYLICAPADAPLTTRGSIIDNCSECAGRVMVAITGQKRLKLQPEMKILCMACFATRTDLNLGEEAGLAGSVEDTNAELRTTVPNLYRNRN